MTDKQLFYEELVREVKEDFAARREMRRPYELTWQLNMNFLMGNQFCNITGRGEIEQDEKYFFWQEREAYNHIAPIIETRVAKLDRVRPAIKVMPFSDGEKHLQAAAEAERILNYAADNVELSQKVTQATTWSETCGTVFYKVVWDKNKGKKLGVSDKGQDIFEGDVDLSVCPPFEIYPDSNVSQTIEECGSIIHAKAYSVSDVKKIWGVDVEGEDIQVFALDGTIGIGGLGYYSTVPNIISQTKHDQVIVIEKYVRPDVNYPNGRLIIVAGDKLLFNGDLPFINRENGQRGFPFVRQLSQTVAGCFWGMCVIDRLIPIQRAYNAVKNRKHEFLNRISMGVLTVEDGSVDVENLQEEGLSPGKVLIYRQGSEPPKIMDGGNVPLDFTYEEERLINEFMVISGTSELSRNSATPTNVTSGVALQLLIDQDDTRLAATADELRCAISKIGQMILSAYKQFALTPRTAKVWGSDGKLSSFTFDRDDILCEKVTVDTQNEINDTVSQRRSMMLDLLQKGVLYDENGNLPESTKSKILKLAGFSDWEKRQTLSSLHAKKAAEENESSFENVSVCEIDDHKIHIEEHTRFLLSDDGKKASDKKKDAIVRHISQHKKFLKKLREEEKGEQL